MRTVAPLLLALVAAGCDDQDVCAPFAGRTCIALEVRAGLGGPTAVDQLLVSSVALGITNALTPDPARAAPVLLPVQVAIIPASDIFAGTPDLDVSGLVNGFLVGRDVIGATVTSGQHASVTAHLVAQFTPDLDGGGDPIDFAGQTLDFAAADLGPAADLAPPAASFHASSTGLNGGNIVGLVVDPQTPATLYAAAFGGGMFKSLNSGTSWSAINSGLPDLELSQLAISFGGVVYVATQNGRMFKSVTGGASWQELFHGPSVSSAIDKLLIDRSGASSLYVFNGGTLFHSTNGGSSFNQTNATSPLPSGLFDALQDTNTSSTLYVLAQSAGVFRSTDSGATWAAFNTGLPSTPFPDGLVADGVNSVLFLTCNELLFQRSSVGGTTWAQMSPVGFPPTGGLGLAIDNLNPAVMYTHELASGGTSGVFHTSNHGANWSALNSGLPETEIPILTVDPTNSANVYAGGRTAGVSRLVAGTSWTGASSGLTARLIRSLAFDPTAPSILYAGTSGGTVFRSSDSGTNWNATGSGLPREMVSALAVDPNDHTTVYAGLLAFRGVFKSINSGGSWGAVNGLSPLPDGVTALIVDPTTSSIVYAATSDQGVFKSLNGANTWSQSNTGLSSLNVRGLVINPRQPATLYATTPNGVFRSSNGGANWSTTGFIDNGEQIVMDPNNASVLYQTTGGFGPPFVWKTVNGGASWTPSDTGLTAVTALAIDARVPTTLYVGGDSGVFQSNNAGGTWVAAPFVASVAPKVKVLLVDPTDSRNVYAATDRLGGLFKSP